MALCYKALSAKATSAIAGRRVSKATNGSRVVMRAGNWLPGARQIICPVTPW
jgi:hypothetical protein